MKRSLSVPFVTAVLVPLLASCGANLARATPSNRDVLTHEELASTNATNVYDAVARLRPSWLNGRGPISLTQHDDANSINPNEARPNVYMNNTRQGDVSYLSNLQIEEVAQLRYYATGEAATRFGMDNPAGVIEVTRR